MKLRLCPACYRTNVSVIRDSNISVAKQLNIFGRFNCYKDIPPAVQAWIAIKADEQGKSRTMVRAGIKANYSRRNNSK